MGNREGSSPSPDISFTKQLIDRASKKQIVPAQQISHICAGFIDEYPRKQMPVIRAQWPHTVDDIVKALDGVWGIVGAIAVSGNKLVLERSFKEPTVYKFVEYKGTDESKPLRELSFSAAQKEAAINEFASLLGFNED